MLDNWRSRIVIVLGLAGIFACMLSFLLLSAVPQLEFNFPLEKDKIFDKTDKFLRLARISSQPLIKKSEVLSNKEGLIYLQKVLGEEKANRKIDSLPLYYWQLDYVYPQNNRNVFPLRNSRNIVRIIVSPIEGKIIGFRRFLQPEEYKHSRILSKNESQAVAYDLFSLIKFNISDFKLTKYSSIERKYNFEWERNIPELMMAKLKVKLEILGDKIGSFNYFFEIPPTELKKIQKGNFSTRLLSIILNLLVIALGIFSLIVSIIKRKELQWRFGLVFALLLLLSSIVNFFKAGDYRSFYLVLFLFTTILGCIIYFFWTMIISSVAKIFAKESGVNMFPVKIYFSIFLSYIFVFAGLGFTLFALILVGKIFKPVTTLGFYSFFSEFPASKFSYFIAPLLSLGAGVFEEIFFRALIITFLRKFLKNTLWAVILSSLVWSFIHVSPNGYSDVYPDFIKGIILLPIGILLGYIFINFGLVCAMVTHYLHDLIVIGSAFLEFSNYRNANENITVILIAAVLPLIAGLYFKLRKS